LVATVSAVPRALSLTVGSAAFVLMIAGCTSHDGSSPAKGTASNGQTSATNSATGQQSGSINKTVPAKSVARARPVATGATASFGNRVTARITKLRNFNAVGQGVGEISGPAVAVSFVITNGSSGPIDLGSVTANLDDAAGIPSVSMIGKPADPFRGVAAAGKSSTATYVFALSKSHRNPVTISLSYTTEAPVVLFVGNVQ
jgi:hypothetical protein